jgi:hypothetical protein
MGTTEVEAAAMHDAILHWAPYLQNGVKFEVVVDHQALVYLTTAAAMSGNRKVMAMIVRLEGFWFDVKYRKGEKHLAADALSRLFRYEDLYDSGTIFPEEEKYFGSIQEEDIALLRRRVSLAMEKTVEEVSDQNMIAHATQIQRKMHDDTELRGIDCEHEVTCSPSRIWLRPY